jgi:glutamate/tyrosine decarboxylase-like PLP-dependent enzyme
VFSRPFVLIISQDVACDYTDLWIHVDAAWAGVALACPEYREVAYLDAINTYAHSFCTNFHKVDVSPRHPRPFGVSISRARSNMSV